MLCKSKFFPWINQESHLHAAEVCWQHGIAITQFWTLSDFTQDSWEFWCNKWWCRALPLSDGIPYHQKQRWIWLFLRFSKPGSKTGALRGCAANQQILDNRYLELTFSKICEIRHSEHPKTCKIRYSEFFSSKLVANKKCYLKEYWSKDFLG